MATIGGWNVSNADAKQWNVVITPPDITDHSEWTPGAARPVMIKSYYGFKTISVSFLVKTSGGRDALRTRCSTLIAHAMSPCELVLDGFTNKFYVVLKNAQHQETSIRHWHVLTLQFVGYEYGSQVTVTKSGETSFTISNAGNVVTPIRIELTPSISTATVTLTGLCSDQNGENTTIIVKNTTKDKTIILDGETGLFTEDGVSKSGDITIWGLPALKAGSNAVTVTANMGITIKYKPRYI